MNYNGKILEPQPNKTDKGRKYTKCGQKVQGGRETYNIYNIAPNPLIYKDITYNINYNITITLLCFEVIKRLYLVIVKNPLITTACKNRLCLVIAGYNLQTLATVGFPADVIKVIAFPPPPYPSGQKNHG